MTINLDIQSSVPDSLQPSDAQFEQWVEASLLSPYQHANLAIRIIDVEESNRLNINFRKKPGPTNILSFNHPDAAAQPADTLVGDLVVCDPLVAKEADQSGIDQMAHWAHLIVHGCLHLQGYDHETDIEAEEMLQHEIDILAQLGIANFYPPTEEAP